jgi:hypothetical protein
MASLIRPDVRPGLSQPAGNAGGGVSAAKHTPQLELRLVDGKIFNPNRFRDPQVC